MPLPEEIGVGKSVVIGYLPFGAPDPLVSSRSGYSCTNVAPLSGRRFWRPGERRYPQPSTSSPA